MKAFSDKANTPMKTKKSVILAVDDDPIICELLEMCFDLPQYELLIAKNADEALKIFRQKASLIDMVLMDIMLPTMNGIELFHVMKDYHPSVKCMFVSGSLGSINLDVLRTEGVLGFIEKPFSIESLLRRVANGLMIDTIKTELSEMD